MATDILLSNPYSQFIRFICVISGYENVDKKQKVDFIATNPLQIRQVADMQTAGIESFLF